jgi:hypothetical protein
MMKKDPGEREESISVHAVVRRHLSAGPAPAVSRYAILVWKRTCGD